MELLLQYEFFPTITGFIGRLWAIDPFQHRGRPAWSQLSEAEKKELLLRAAAAGVE